MCIRNSYEGKSRKMKGLLLGIIEWYIEVCAPLSCFRCYPNVIIMSPSQRDVLKTRNDKEVISVRCSCSNGNYRLMMMWNEKGMKDREWNIARFVCVVSTVKEIPLSPLSTPMPGKVWCWKQRWNEMSLLSLLSWVTVSYVNIEETLFDWKMSSPSLNAVLIFFSVPVLVLLLSSGVTEVLLRHEIINFVGC